jgi:hypothetical protein
MTDKLIEDWVRCQEEGAGAPASRFAAWEKVEELVHTDPEVGWSIVLRLVEESPDDLVLSNVAAGPLEDLLVKHGDAILDRVEEQARRDPKFRRCLTGVWGLPSAIRDRLAKYIASVPNPLDGTLADGHFE